MSIRKFFVFVVAVFALAAMALAQTQTCRLDGTVQDATGAVVPGASVHAVNVKTQLSVQTASNAEGIFVLAALQPGVYNLTVETAGFRKFDLNDIQLDAGATVSEIVKLEVGPATEAISVEAKTVVIQTGESQVSRAVTLRDIDTLPALGRTALLLAPYTAPGTAVYASDASYSRINGARQGSNNTTLDGIDANDAVAPRFGLSMTATNTDSLGEVRITTSGGKAEYGRNAGGQVEMITRTGTNLFHGNGFDYMRNRDFNANDFFSNLANVARPEFTQNIFGGSFGGPIKHDKLFIFGNYQGRRTYQQVLRTRTVPTANAKAGLFTWLQAGTTTPQTYSIVANDPLHLGIDPAIAKLLAIFPAPNTTSVGDGYNSSGYSFNQPNNSYEDQFTIRGDYNLNSNNHIFYRHSWQRNYAIDSLNSADAPFPGGAQGAQGGHRWGVAGGWDWTINASLINEFRYGHQSATADFWRPERLPGIMYSFYSFTNPILTALAQGRNSPINEYTDNLTWIHGRHTAKAGITARYTLQYGYNYAGVYPTATLATTYAPVPTTVGPSGLSSANLQIFQGLYNDLLGRISSVAQTFYTDLSSFQAAGTPSVRNYNFHDYGSFIQDDWKLLPNLTLNIGLRWEIFGTPTEENGLQGTVSSIKTLAATNPQNNLSVAKMATWYNTDKHDFAPRFGLSWDPSHEGKMAIRANYGIFYDRIVGATTSLVDSNSPGFADGETSFPNQVVPDVRASQNPAMPTHAAAPLITPLDNRNTSIVVFNPNLRSGYVHQYSLTLQRELLRGTILEAGFVGNHSVKLFTDRDINQPMVYQNFLGSVQQLQTYIANGTAPPATNTLVKIFGTPAAAVSGLGSTAISQGQLGTLANTLDRTNYTKYAAAGVSDYYLRPFPQFNQLIYGSNDGKSFYDSLQVSLRRNLGALKYTFNFTWSKSLDNGSVDGNGFTVPLDNNNLNLNYGRSDYERPKVLTYQIMYTLPIGNGKALGGSMPHWADSILGGWDLGAMGVWESGPPMTISSGRATGPGTATATADYNGDRNIGSISRQGSGVFFLDSTLATTTMTFPLAGGVGTSGRNAFRGPRFFDTDVSLVKRFKITERKSVTYRAEAYNLWNNVNFSTPAVSIATPTTFGKISSSVNGARVMQMALRFDF
ncbi:MAG: TonB-dependent receptor [Bryobacteraceae bacterium]|jgi:hypothetical protein